MRARRAEPALVAAGLAALYLIWQPPSADLAAQLFRTWLFDEVGFTVWNGQWFAGHHVPAYSVMFPPLAGLLGARVVGALSCVAAAILFERLARERYGERARLGAAWFGAATTISLFTGRLTYALGVAIGLGALLALQRGRTALAVAVAALCPMGSPVAGLFLALAAGTVALTDRRRDALGVAAAAFIATVTLALAFPEPGVARFLLRTLWPILLFVAAVVALVPRENRALRAGAVLYGVACVLAFVVDSPMGGHAARLGTMFGPPLLALALWRRRNLALVLAAPALLYWQWDAPWRDTTTALGDPAITAGFYAPLNRYLSGRVSPGRRVEIPYTRNHWEHYWVARRFPLARGWERQLDARVNALFYRQDKRVDPAAYRRWLTRLAVEYVAVPRARLDYTGIPEARLVTGGLPYLRPVWRSRDWRVYRFLSNSTEARLTLKPDSFVVHATKPGPIDASVRYTPYWTATSPGACVAPGRSGLTRVHAARRGRIKVVARVAPWRRLRRTSTCGNPVTAR
jgi:hypothetical protein